MQVNLSLFFSKLVNLSLAQSSSLLQMDRETSLFQNEEALRKSSSYYNAIASFLTYKQHYIKAIPDEKKKSGRITLTYLERENALSFLPPLYHEDLENLHIPYQELDEKIVIKKVKDRVLAALKEKKGEEIATFFRSLGSIYGTTYNIQRGYYRFLKEIAYYENASSTKAKQVLFKMFKDSLEWSEDETRLSSTYTTARKIYAFAKENGYFPKRQVKNLTLATEDSAGLEVSKEIIKINKILKVKREEKQGTATHFNQFLDDYLQKHPNERARMSDIAYEYQYEYLERRNQH